MRKLIIKLLQDLRRFTDPLFNYIMNRYILTKYGFHIKGFSLEVPGVDP